MSRPKPETARRKQLEELAKLKGLDPSKPSRGMRFLADVGTYKEATGEFPHLADASPKSMELLEAAATDKHHRSQQQKNARQKRQEYEHDCWFKIAKEFAPEYRRRNGGVNLSELARRVREEHRTRYRVPRSKLRSWETIRKVLAKHPGEWHPDRTGQ